MCCIILIDDFQGFEGVHRCCLDETLHTIIDRLTDAGVSESKTCLIYLQEKLFLAVEIGLMHPWNQACADLFCVW